MSLGVAEAAASRRRHIDIRLAVDAEQSASKTFAINHEPAFSVAATIDDVLDRDLGSRLSGTERRWRSRVGHVDLLLGGPPCQGHSDLNNHTRRSDPRNRLFLRMVRAAEVFEPEAVLIENVPGVVHDRDRVVETTHDALTRLGYTVQSEVIDCHPIGVPQLRRRFVMVAHRRADPLVWPKNGAGDRDVAWAIRDLSETGVGHPILDVPFDLSDDNRKRVDFLFDNDLYELPDRLRPDCHRLKQHSYRSVYGRLRWDRPSNTITSGFGSPGRGRFIHPERRRTLTPREAARLQYLPDWYTYCAGSRERIKTHIGNVVPPRLAEQVALALWS